MSGTNNRAISFTGRNFAAPSRGPAAAPIENQAAVYTPGAGDGRGRAALLLADRIARMAAPQQREDVTPELEPLSPSLTTEEPGEDFADNEDVTDEMEPFDPTIESALRAEVTGDESEVT